MDPDLIQILKNEFSNDDQRKFLDHFSLYLKYDAYSDDFVIDLDDVYEWIGFTRKDAAKRLLVKHFNKDTEYSLESLIPSPVEQVHGGHNKEKIKMSIGTFKAFCMIANTEKGKSTRKYYTKMENIFFKYITQKQASFMKELEEDVINREERLKHQTLLAILDKKRTIYFTRVKKLSNGKFIIKLGWTNGLADRNRNHATHFGSSMLLDVFECQQNIEFESFLKNHPRISAFKYEEEIIDNVKSSETFLVSQEEYKFILDIVKNQIKYYQGFNHDALLEMEKINLQNKLLDFLAEKNITNENIPIILDYLKTTPSTSTEASTSADITPIGRTGATRKVQKYDANSLKLISTYTGIMEVLRNHPETSKFGIKNAAENNTIYCNFRWFFIDVSAENKQYDIPPTKEIKSSIPRFVAMLDKDQTKIMKVFVSQEEAMKGINISRKQTINDHIRTGKVYKNTMCFKLYDDCSDDLKNEFLSRETLPEKKFAKGTCINQINVNTKTVIATFPSISEVLKKVCISRAKLKEACETGCVHAGYFWEFA